MRRIRILAVAGVALLAACSGLMSDPEPNVVYQADRQAYTPQDSIVTSLVNTSDAEVGYNLCLTALEKRTSGGWTRVARNPEQPCILPLYILRPGESATYREAASRLPGPGIYRLRTAVETPVPGPQRDVVTDPFILEQ
ncbi:MAG TPA: hypothetical protein VF006_00075 [Longimicrobium sp.]